MENLTGIFATYQNDELTQSFIKRTIEEKLAVCVVTSAIESTYFWEGKIEKSNEILILFKCLQSKKTELYNLINDSHPYKIPFISCIDLKDVPVPYLNWSNSN